MTVRIVRNSRGNEAPSPELTEDNTLFPFAMYYNGSKLIAYSDDLTDLLGVLIEGYGDMDAEQALTARIRFAITSQVSAQANINSGTAPEVWSALSDEDRAVLEGDRREQPRVDHWDPEVPLVLVETGYAPYSDVDQPISGIADVQNPPNLIWLRPMDEWEFLTSLSSAGVVTLCQADDA